MLTGQFFRGKIGGIQKNFESPNLDKLLPPEKLQTLADNFEVGEYPKFFKKEKVLAKTVISPAENSDGRKGGIVNHTVLYKFDPTVTHETVTYIFDVDTFILELQAGKRRFKMPPKPQYPSDVDFAIIDLPPPIEWEVDS